MKTLPWISLCLVLLCGCTRQSNDTKPQVSPKEAKAETSNVPPIEPREMNRQRAAKAIRALLAEIDTAGLKCLLGRVDAESEGLLKSFMGFIDKDSALPKKDPRFNLDLPTQLDESTLKWKTEVPPVVEFLIRHPPVKKAFSLRVEKGRVLVFLGERVPVNEDALFGAPLSNLAADAKTLLHNLKDPDQFRKIVVDFGGAGEDATSLLAYVGLNILPENLARIEVSRLNDEASPSHFQLEVTAWETGVLAEVELSEDLAHVKMVRQIGNHPVGSHLRAALKQRTP